MRRSSKSEAPKSEIRSLHPLPHWVRPPRGTEAPVASALSAEPRLENFAISAFRFPSDFGLRISDFLPGLGLRPSGVALA